MIRNGSEVAHKEEGDSINYISNASTELLSIKQPRCALMSEDPTKTEKSSHQHLACVLESYLKGEGWVTEDRLFAEI